MTIPTFNNLLLLGRPAAGKSEWIDFLRKVPQPERVGQYHIGSFVEIDDFPWIWEKFMEDDIWERAGYPRRYSFSGANPGLAKEGGPLFDFCIQKFNEEYAKRYQNNTNFFLENTLMIEFSRGGKSGYRRALENLSPAILQRASILYIGVSYEESCRRNDARYEAKRQHSILAHKVPDETMEFFYTTDDWQELTNRQSSGRLAHQGLSIPFVTVDNEREPKTFSDYEKRYGPALKKLMELHERSL